MAWNGSDCAGGRTGEGAISAAIPKKGAKARGFGEFLNSLGLGRWSVAGLGALGIIGGICWGISAFRSGRGGASVPEVPEVADVPSLVKEHRPAASGHAGRVTLPVAPKAPKALAATQPRVVAVETNAMGAVIEDLVLPDGREIRRITPPPPVWDNAADQLIAMAISIESGVDAPPLPVGISDREFLQALKKPIVINAEDPASLQRLKRQVREARNEILDTMAKTGKSFEEILNERRDAMNEGTALWRVVQEDYASAWETMTDEEREEYVAQVNALLEERGARPLSTEGRRRGRPRDSQ